MHSTGVGKAIFAYSTEDFIRKITKNGLEAFTKTTILDMDILFSELAGIRELGYPVDNEENEQHWILFDIFNIVIKRFIYKEQIQD